MKKFSVKIKSVFAAAILVSSAQVFAERSPDYISPNNDGVKDFLEVPLKIKERRYISKWSFVVTNEAGEIVRIISNKERFEEKITFKSFFKRLFTPKQNVEVPSSVIWNGFLDDGSLAKDGNYYYYFTATDDSGNEGQTSKHVVVVDNTAPEIKLTQLSDNQKNFGEGSKSTLTIQQSGSKEELWTAYIKDTEGKTVRTYTWTKAAPVAIEWDGTNDSSSIISDGVYNYEITSTDLAGNVSEKAQITNIIFSAEKPETAVAINGSRYFAPEGKTSSIKTMDLAVSVPLPVSKANGLTAWKVEIVGKKDGKTYRSYSGTNNPPSGVKFDGKDDSGVPLSEGEYRAKVTARYLNGYEPPAVYSGVFVLDNTPPKASASTAKNVFNGNGTFKISQSADSEEAYTGEKKWTGKIVSKTSGNVVKQFDFGTSLPDSVEWNGNDESGFLASNDTYIYTLEGTDLAGNTASYPSSEFKLDSTPTEVSVSVAPAAFSTTGNSSVKAVTISSRAQASSGLKSYKFAIFNKDNKEVWSSTGTSSLPASLKWNGLASDGTVCADGTYYVMLDTVAVSETTASAKSGTFVIDSSVPTVDLSADYTVFSPDGTSSRQTLPVKVTNASSETKWVGEVKNAAGKTVRTFTWPKGKPSDFAWDGTYDNGNKAENGTYSISLSATDEAGNSVSKALKNIQLDARPVTAYVTNELSAFSPNGDGILETQKFTIHTSLKEGVASWSFVIADEKGSAVKTWSNKDSANLPSVINWAGDVDADEKAIADGTFTGKLRVDYAKGNSVEAVTSPFICTAVAPVLTVRTSPKYFSPDNDGNDDDLYIQLKGETKAALKNWSFTIYDRNGAPFWKTSGKSSITERIIWDGRGNNGELVTSAEDYPCVFEVTDTLGMTSRVEKVINVDVLVVRDGDKLKMQVPSIIFRSDAADFLLKGEKDASGKAVPTGITAEQKANNERVIKRIAEILKKFSDYNVTIEGHSNRTTTDPNEETQDNPALWGRALTPLSRERAEYVKELLVKLGISKSRLNAAGKGGTEPVADTKNKSGNWKNRRVEFVLEK